MSTKYRKSDIDELHQIVNFFKECEPNTILTESMYQWKYVYNPVGLSRVYFAEDENDTLVGVYSIIPWKFIVNEEIIEGYQAVDIMVHPSQRGKGTIVGLSKYIFEDLKTTTSPFILGFPNERIYPIHLKVGWKSLGTFETYVKILRVNKYCKRLETKFTKPIFSIANNILKTIDSLRCLFYNDLELYEASDFSRLGESFQKYNAGDMKTLRSQQYLKWRYIDKPENKYHIYLLCEKGKPQCYIVTIEDLNEVTIVDLIASTRKVIIPALNIISNHFRKDPLKSSVRCACHSDLSHALKRSFFIHRNVKWPIIIYNIDNGVLNSSIDTFTWHILGGDIEVL